MWFYHISLTDIDLEASSKTTIHSNPQLWPQTSQNGEGNVAAGAQWAGFTPDLDGSWQSLILMSALSESWCQESGFYCWLRQRTNVGNWYEFCAGGPWTDETWTVPWKFRHTPKPSLSSPSSPMSLCGLHTSKCLESHRGEMQSRRTWHPGSVCLGVERSPGACLLNRHSRQLRPAPSPHFRRRCPSAAIASQTSVCLRISWHLVKTQIPIQAQCDPARLTVAGHQVDLRPLAYSTGRMIMSQRHLP